MSVDPIDIQCVSCERHDPVNVEFDQQAMVEH